MKYELYKLVNKRLVMIFLLLALLINGIYGTRIVRMRNKAVTREYADGRGLVEGKIEGEITNDKINYVSKEYERLERLVRSGNFSKEHDENTYTGHTFSDCSLFREFYNDMRYACDYSERVQNIVARAAENVDIYKAKGNEYKSRYNQKVMALYEGRIITVYYATRGWNEYFGYQYSNMLVVMLLLIVNAVVFSGEREEGMAAILLTSRKGRMPIFFRKAAACMAASSGMAVAMYLEDFLIFYEGFQLRGIWNPIYSIREWELCPLNLSIGGFALAAAAYKMAGVFVLTALVMLASSLARSSLVAGLISVLMVMGAAVVNNLKWDCDILGLLTSAIDLKKMEVCRWLDMPVLKIDFQAATGLLLMVAALATAYFLETRWKCVRRRERI